MPHTLQHQDRIAPLRCRDTRESRTTRGTRETSETPDTRNTSLAGQLTPIRTKADQQYPLRGELHVGCLLAVQTHWAWPLLPSSTRCMAHWIGITQLSVYFHWGESVLTSRTCTAMCTWGLHRFRWATCLSVGLQWA